MEMKKKSTSEIKPFFMNFFCDADFRRDLYRVKLAPVNGK